MVNRIVLHFEETKDGFTKALFESWRNHFEKKNHYFIVTVRDANGKLSRKEKDMTSLLEQMR